MVLELLFDPFQVSPGPTLTNNEHPNNFVWERACVLFLDAVSYSTQMERSPLETRQTLTAHFAVLEAQMDRLGGRIIDKAGDGIFAEFPTALAGVNCAQLFQNEVAASNQNLPTEQRMRFRCGISFGDILREDHLISGPKVNIAARLQSLAEPGTINIDGDAQRELNEESGLYFEDLGFRVLKGISNPVRVWQVLDHAPRQNSQLEDLTKEYRVPLEGPEQSRSIAVLAFEVPPGQDDYSYMAEGLAADLADDLSRSKWLKVVSSRSSINYSARDYSDLEISKELEVRYLLKGRIRISGKMMRVSVSLVDCYDNEIVWSDKFDGTNDSIFDFQDEIANLIVGNIEPEYLRHESKIAASGRPRDVNAWDLLMRSRWHFWRGTPSNIKQALECAEKALQLDPSSSQTLSQLSFCHMSLIWLSRAKDPIAQQEEALRLAKRAISLDPTNANAYFTFGTAQSLGGDNEAAIAAERRALEIDPNHVGALGELARLLAFSGHSREARNTALKAIEISPSDPHLSLWARTLALAAFVEKKYGEAAKLGSEAAAKRPDWFFNYALIAASEALNGNLESAVAAYRECNRLMPEYSLQALKMGHPFSRSADFDLFIDGLTLAGWREG